MRREKRERKANEKEENRENDKRRPFYRYFWVLPILATYVNSELHIMNAIGMLHCVFRSLTRMVKRYAEA